MTTIEGRLETREIPTGVQHVPVMNSMMNLGYAVQVAELDKIKQLIEPLVRQR